MLSRSQGQQSGLTQFDWRVFAVCAHQVCLSACTGMINPREVVFEIIGTGAVLVEVFMQCHAPPGQIVDPMEVGPNTRISGSTFVLKQMAPYRLLLQPAPTAPLVSRRFLSLKASHGSECTSAVPPVVPTESMLCVCMSPLQVLQWLVDIITLDQGSTFPRSSEAQRVLCFWASSLHNPGMQPAPEQLSHIPSMTTLTPHYEEDVLYGLDPEYVRNQMQTKRAPKEDGDEASYLINGRADETETLKYLRISFRDEWGNFIQRLRGRAEQRCKLMEEHVSAACQRKGRREAAAEARAAAGTSATGEGMAEAVTALAEARAAERAAAGTSASGEAMAEALAKAQEAEQEAAKRKQILSGDPMQISAGQFGVGMPLALYAEDVLLWASMRGQLLTRTVKGMMYYQEALKQLYLMRLGESIKGAVASGLAAKGVKQRLTEKLVQQGALSEVEREERVGKKLAALEGRLVKAVAEQLTICKYQYVVSRWVGLLMGKQNCCNVCYEPGFFYIRSSGSKLLME